MESFVLPDPLRFLKINIQRNKIPAEWIICIYSWQRGNKSRSPSCSCEQLRRDPELFCQRRTGRAPDTQRPRSMELWKNWWKTTKLPAERRGQQPRLLTGRTQRTGRYRSDFPETTSRLEAQAQRHSGTDRHNKLWDRQLVYTNTHKDKKHVLTSRTPSWVGFRTTEDKQEEKQTKTTFCSNVRQKELRNP